MNNLHNKIKLLKNSIYEKTNIINRESAILKSHISKPEAIMMFSICSFVIGYFVAKKINLGNILFTKLKNNVLTFL